VSGAQHAGLTPERWAQFDYPRQILMISNELHRAGKLDAPAARDRRRAALERVLALTDLTIRVQERPSRRRELLRWRDLVAEAYLDPSTGATRQRELMRSLRRMSPESSVQVPRIAPRAPAT
jgi:hypothetical protein